MTPSEVEIDVPVYKTALFDVQPDLVIDKNRFDYTVTPSAVYLKGAVNDVEAVKALKTNRSWIDVPGEYELTIAVPENVNAFSSYTGEETAAVSTVKIVVTEKPVPEEPVENGENAA